MLTLSIIIPEIGADLDAIEEDSLAIDSGQFTNSKTSLEKKETQRQVRIVEHRLSTLELEKLKQEIGIWEENKNYNQKINGYGTGLRPPTDAEWIDIAEQVQVVEDIILLNQADTQPTSVDNSIKPWFPPIGNQGSEGSCVAWAVGYYVKTFQEAKEHAWNLSMAQWEGIWPGYPNPEYQDRIISPDFLYHLINGGVDEGAYYYDAINLVCSIGVCSWEKMPYDQVDHVGWPSEEAWKEAPLFRGNSSSYLYMSPQTDDDIQNLKNWIASENLAVISIDAYQYENLTSNDVWTLDNYINPNTNHANTIVGYDDAFEYSENGEIHYGAFKIANSWGIGTWENIDDGYYWISYEAMKQRINSCWFYADLLDYEPELVASFSIDHSKRNECTINVGIGDHVDPDQTKSFSEFVDGGTQPFCTNNILFDI
ncbi:MAG: C1 family peptidase, partial [Candidatus Pacebacteria bacterium]|nr:C1 family peptidase [Candidatus Paceibacterota bacterium]